MNSKLIKLPDWQEMCRKIGWADAPGEEKVQAMVKQELTRGLVTFEEQAADEAIEKGCRVTLKTQSTLPKFNREKTPVTVGSNLYDAGIEALLVGMKTGESANTVVKGEEVHLTVIKVEKKVYPPLTDRLVQEKTIENVSTLSDYEMYTRTKLRREYAERFCEQLLCEVMNEAAGEELCEADIQAVIDCEFESLDFRFKLSEMSDEEWTKSFGDDKLQSFYEQIYPDVAAIFGTTSKASFYEVRRAAAVQRLRDCLVLRSMLKTETEETDPAKNLHAREKLLESLEQQVLLMIYGG